MAIKHDKESTVKTCNGSNLIYNQNFTFSVFNNLNKFHNSSSELKFASLNEFSDCLISCNNNKAKKENTKERKDIVLDTASELYNDLLEIYLDGQNR